MYRLMNSLESTEENLDSSLEVAKIYFAELKAAS